MIRIILLAILLAVAMTANAGWKMYSPGQKEPAISSTDDPNAPRPVQTQTKVQIEDESASMFRKQPVEEVDSVDMRGVEWRTSRGYYSGRNSDDTRRYGYRAGTYLIEYSYRGGGNFIVWMHTRRGQKELPINVIGSKKGSRTVQLKADDEVFFEVTTTGNWEMTMEKMR